MINCYNSEAWRLEKHESRDENCLCKFRNSRLIFSKQFLTVTQERMFQALIPVKFEICVWSDSGEEVEVEERKRLGSYLSLSLKIDFRSLSIKFINGDRRSPDRFIKRDEEAVC